MQGMALALSVVFALTATLGCMAAHRRRTGDWGLRVDGARGSAVAKLSLLLLAASLASSFAATSLAVAGAVEAPPLGGSAGIVVGKALCVAGMVVTFIGQQQMGDAWRLRVDFTETTPLVGRGLFEAVRNPIYSGVMLFGAGLLVWVPHLLMLAGCVAGLVGFELLVRKVEEPYLLLCHVDAYRAYAARTGRFVPGIGRLRPRD